MRTARSLEARGERARVLVHAASAPLFEGSGLEVRATSDPAGAALAARQFGRRGFASVVHCDLQGNGAFAGERLEQALSWMVPADAPVLSIDVWCSARTGHTPDVFAGGAVSLNRGVRSELLSRVPASHVITPSPFAPPDTAGAFDALPERAARARRGRRAPGRPRTVLFLTAPWQHHPPHPDGRATAALLPALLARYVRSQPANVRLVHIGPEPYGLSSVLGNRYLWMRSLSAAALDAWLHQSDLLVSANLSASTIGRALVAGVPVLAIENRRSAACYAGLPAEVRKGLSAPAARLVAGHMPIYPFRVWPLGYHRFLSPIVEAGPFARAITRVELLDEVGVTAAIRRMVFDSGPRAAVLARQASYVSTIRRLPSAASAILARCA